MSCGAKECGVSTVQYLKYCYWAYLAQPAADRAIYRALRQLKPKSIVELGIGKGLRTRRVMELSLQHAAADDLRYTGIDLFEARPESSPGMALKQAHTQLKSFGIKVQLVPGDPYSALARAANSLRSIDLFIISRDQDPESLEHAWFYFPRMLHPKSVVLLEVAGAKPGETRFQDVSHSEIATLASRHMRSRRAA